MARKKSKLLREEIIETDDVEEPSFEKQPEETYTTSSTPISVETIEFSKSPNLILAKLLEGTPNHFPFECTEDLQTLLKEGIAANFGDAGWARGHKWRSFIRKG